MSAEKKAHQQIQVGSRSLSRDDILLVAQRDNNPSLVGIDQAAIERINWPQAAFEPMQVALEGKKGSHPASALAFIVAMDALNYRFWNRNEDRSLSRYQHNGKTGAKALWRAFSEGWGEELDCAAMSALCAGKGLHEAFGDIPDPASRKIILDEILDVGALGAVCQELSDQILTSGKGTVRHASHLAQYFPFAFNDPYLKKAQLAIAMFAGHLHSKSIKIDVSDLTAFADYQVPRVLRALGIINYSDELAIAVDSGEFLAQDSQEERAIRGATILACEAIAQHTGSTAANIDNLLWLSQDVAGDSRFHLTETTWY